MNPAAFVYPLVRLVLFVVGTLNRLRRRLFARRGTTLLAEDPRPPVLFLRSFGEDAAGLASHALETSPFESREEPEVAKMFRVVGPVVAIQRPGTLLPETGAARIRVKESEWQETVKSLIRRCRFVVIRIGATAGLLWEIRTVIGEARPEQLVLYLGMDDREERWRAFQRAVADFFPAALPDAIHDAQFLAFDPGWKPQALGTHEGPDTAALPGSEKYTVLGLATFIAIPIVTVLVVAGNDVNLAIFLAATGLAVTVGVGLMRIAWRLRVYAGIVMGALPLVIALFRVNPDLLEHPIVLLPLWLTWFATLFAGFFQLRTRLLEAHLSHIGLLARASGPASRPSEGETGLRRA